MDKDSFTANITKQRAQTGRHFLPWSLRWIMNVITLRDNRQERDIPLSELVPDMRRLLRLQWREFIHEIEDADGIDYELIRGDLATITVFQRCCTIASWNGKLSFSNIEFVSLTADILQLADLFWDHCRHSRDSFCGKEYQRFAKPGDISSLSIKCTRACLSSLHLRALWHGAAHLAGYDQDIQYVWSPKCFTCSHWLP